MKNKQKWMASALAVIMTAGLLSGCSGTGTKPPAETTVAGQGEAAGNTTITVWAWDDNYNVPIMKLAGEYYAKEHPEISVEVVSLAKEDVYTKMQTALAGGGSGMPDIVLMEDYVSGKYLKSFKGSFADLTDQVDYSNFLDFKKASVSYDGRQYGVPLDTGASVLFYRTDMLEKAGYQEEDIENCTWEKFMEIGEAVKATSGADMIVEMAANKTTLLRSMMQSAGYWYFDENGTIDIVGNEALQAGFDIIKQMKDKGILFEAEGTGDRAGALNSGKVAAIVNGPWMASTIKAAEDQSGLWKITTTPRFSNLEGAVNASNLGGSSWYVAEKSANKDVAVELLKTVFTDTEYYKEIMLDYACVSGYKPALSGEAFETEDEYFGNQKIYALFADTLDKVPGVNYGGYVAEANDAVTTGLSAYMSGGATIGEGLAAAEEQLKNQLGI